VSTSRQWSATTLTPSSQPAIGREGADVDAGHHHGALGGHQVPNEAELVVMHVDGAESPEAVGGKLGLHAGHHLTDGRMALGL